MKMALHAQKIRKKEDRTQFLGLTHGYHGETALTLSISDLGRYKDPYQDILTHYPFIKPVYVNHTRDPLWSDCSALWPNIEKQLNVHRDTLAAVVFEPILQGAGGMRLYSADFLKRLAQWAHQQEIYLIADEIMTGIGRTGTWLASEHARIEPDFVCLSKGLTSGCLAFSAILTKDSIYELFYDTYDNNRNFLHSQTYAGNAIGAAAALATLKIIINDNLLAQISNLEKQLWEQIALVQVETRALKNIRGIGGIIAADLDTDNRHAGFEIFKVALQNGAFLRPIGNTVYWTPPYIIEESDLKKLQSITCQAIKTVLG